MKDFWSTVDQLRAIDGMADKVWSYTRYPHNRAIFAPIELKDHELVKSIAKKAIEVRHDGDNIIYVISTRCNHNRGGRYSLYLEKR